MNSTVVITQVNEAGQEVSGGARESYSTRGEVVEDCALETDIGPGRAKRFKVFSTPEYVGKKYSMAKERGDRRTMKAPWPTLKSSLFKGRKPHELPKDILKHLRDSRAGDIAKADCYGKAGGASKENHKNQVDEGGCQFSMLDQHSFLLGPLVKINALTVFVGQLIDTCGGAVNEERTFVVSVTATTDKEGKPVGHKNMVVGVGMTSADAGIGDWPKIQKESFYKEASDKGVAKWHKEKGH